MNNKEKNMKTMKKGDKVIQVSQDKVDEMLDIGYLFVPEPSTTI